MSNKDILLIGDTSTNTNWGSQATSMALRNLLVNNEINIKYTLFQSQLTDYETRTVYHNNLSFLGYSIKEITKNLKNRDMYGLGRVLLEYQDSVPRHVNEFSRFERKIKRGELLRDKLEMIDQIDAVVINGEGMMWKGSRYSRYSLFLAYIAKKYYDKECYLVNTTVDFKSNIFTDFLHKILHQMDRIVFREPISAKKYEEEIGLDNYEIGADAAFTHSHSIDKDTFENHVINSELNVTPFATSSFDPSIPYACVAGSSHFAAKNDYSIFDSFQTLCEKLLQIVPQVVLVVSATADDQLMRSISTKLDIPLVGLSTSTFQGINLLANADLYIGGRYHPTIFSLLGNTPIIPFKANTHKMEGLLELVGYETSVINGYELANEITYISERTRDILNSDSTHEFKLDENHIWEMANENVKVIS